jgi:DNA-binding CsgD family transcriptional regulator
VAIEPVHRAPPEDLLQSLGLSLDAIDAPALVVACSGKILSANAIARVTLESHRDAVGRAAATEPPGRDEPAWTFTPLRGHSGTLGFLAIRRPALPEHELERVVKKATARWELTHRQREVLDLVARGLTNELIAETLGIRRRTVEFHVTAIFDKAGTANRATLISRLHEA